MSKEADRLERWLILLLDGRDEPFLPELECLSSVARAQVFRKAVKQSEPDAWRLIVWLVLLLGSWFVGLPFLVVVGCHLWYASRANPGLAQPACQLVGAVALLGLWQAGLAFYNVLYERPRLRRCLWRLVPGLCDHCGYNLTGNLSGRCPECGRPSAA